MESNLHTKAFIVDRNVMFLGSFNWDPRSAYINMELGVIIESPVITATIAARIDEKLSLQNHVLFPLANCLP